MNQKSDINEILEKYSNSKRDMLIPILQETQEKYGYISKESVVSISKFLNLPASKIFGVATFYNQFRLQPIGKNHIQVCRGTACHVKGSKAVLDKLIQELKIQPGETSKDGNFSIEVVACIGACGLAPVMSINGKIYAGVTPDKIKSILNNYKTEKTNAV